LAIIGIIAAITIPGIVANHQKKALETQFAKSYRTLSTAVQMAVAEHGDISTWEWKEDKTYTGEEKDEFVKKYFIPYLNVAKFCPSDNSDTSCTINEKYKTLNDKTDNNYAKAKSPGVMLADGSSAYFVFAAKDRSHELGLDVDINGLKKPNTVGRDLFSFHLFKETGQFLPCGIIEQAILYNEETQSYTLMSEEKRNSNCSPGGSGWYCTARIIQDGFKINY